ncbi:hypothetical protein [Natronomonas sp.]|mgnify:CR=1 FL=1|jgi:hypothetical protein|uniref:hypothetical protein n=1 Tax=Natronomonas sp. TaxID=2184060 RepID=UPI003989C62D
MTDHPRLASTDEDEPAIAVTLDPDGGANSNTPKRETFTLSTRAAGLVVDELEYSGDEEVASVTTRVLLLTGGAYLPDEKVDPVDVVQRLRSPDGGKHPTDREVERVAKYLRSAEVEQRVRWLAEELVEGSRLAEVMSAEEIRTQRGRMNGLRGIAKDL